MSQYSPAPAPAAKAKKPLYKRWWVWLVGIIALLVIIGVARGLGDTSIEPGTAAPVNTPAAPDTEQPELAEGASDERPGIGDFASWSGFGSGGTVTLTNEIARRLTSGDGDDVRQFGVAEEALDDLR